MSWLGRHVPIIVVVAGLLLVAAVIGGMQASGYAGWPGVEPTRQKLTLGAVSDNSAALIWIAEERGYFTAAGLDVTLRDYGTGEDALDAVSAGEIDIAAAIDFTVVKRGFEVPALRVLGTIASGENHALVARKDRGIAAPKDIKGKKVGVTHGSRGQYSLEIFLLFNDLHWSDVQTVDLSPEEMLPAIDAGRVDAILTWQPYVHMAGRALGDNASNFPAQYGQDMFLTLVTHMDRTQARFSGFARLMRALIAAEAFLIDDPAAAKRIVAARLGVGTAYLADVWPGYKFFVRFPQSLLMAMEDQATWLVESKRVDAVDIPNYIDVLHPEPLAMVDPGLVTVVR